MIARLIAIFSLFIGLMAASGQEPLQPRRPDGPPPGGPRPWDQDIAVYRVNPDGSSERLATFERAGVATVARLKDGRLLAAHQHFPEGSTADFDKVAVHFSEDAGKTWSAPEVIQITGLPEGMRFPFDPTLLPLPDGRIRLYFTSVKRGRNEAPPAIYSAISTDGVHYEVEPGMRFGIDGRKVIDCAVVLQNGVFHLYSPDNGPEGPRPGDSEPSDGRGYHAVSDDGLSFRRVEDVRIEEGRRQWLGCAASDGKAITFYGTGGGGIWRAMSEDGSSWKLTSPLRVRAADPGVVALPDGSLIVVGTTGPRPGTPSDRRR